MALALHYARGHLIKFRCECIRAGNMGRARWAGPNWSDTLEGRAVKLATRIESEPFGQARINRQPIQVRAGPARLARIFFNDLLRFFLNPIVNILMKMKIKGIVDFI